MYSVTISGHFDSAHFLRNYEGKCQRMHGHRWTYQVTLQGTELDETGMLIDFTVLKPILKELIDEHLDHYVLNERVPFDVLNPTAEHIAWYIHSQLNNNWQLPERVELQKVRVLESPDCWAEYWEEK